MLIIGGSLLVTSAIVPDYQEEVAAMQEQVLMQRGQDAAVAKQAADRTRATSDLSLAIQGFVGTVITALVISLIAAAFLRRKRDAPVVDEKWSEG